MVSNCISLQMALCSPIGSWLIGLVLISMKFCSAQFFLHCQQLLVLVPSLTLKMNDFLLLCCVIRWQCEPPFTLQRYIKLSN